MPSYYHCPVPPTRIAAPCFRIENVFVLAGIPDVMQAMFEGLAGDLRQGRPFLTRTLTTDRREGEIAAGLTGIQDRFPDISIGSYPFFGTGGSGVNLVLRGIDADRLERARMDLEAFIKSLGGKVIAGEHLDVHE